MRPFAKFKTGALAALFLSIPLFAAGSMPWPQNLNYGLEPTGGEAANAALIKARYESYKTAFLKNSSSIGTYIHAPSTEGDGKTVSEGHGYGMILSAIMDDKTTFDALLSSYENHKYGGTNLMSWILPVQIDNGAATDGDLDIAYALLLADKQWGGSYKTKASALIQDIWDSEMYRGGEYIVPAPFDEESSTGHYDTYGQGDYTNYSADMTRPSDWMPGHFRAFNGIGSGTNWSGAVAGVYKFYNNYKSSSGLVPDFFNKFSAAKPKEVEAETDGEYNFNACRVPLRFAMDYATSKSSESKAALTILSNFIDTKTGGDPDKIAPGYKLDGSLGTGVAAIGSTNWYTDLAYVGPFGAGLVATDKQDFMDAIWEALQDNSMYDTGDEGAYSYALGIISQIVMNGNWWGPNSSVVTTPTAPTDISLSNSTVFSTATAGDLVGTLSASDVNSGESFTFTLPTASSQFEISGNQLKVKGALTVGTVTLAVKVTDKDKLTYQKNLTITVKAPVVSAVLENLGWYAYSDTASGSAKSNSTLTGGKGELGYDDLFVNGKVRCEFNFGTTDDKGTADNYDDDISPSAALCSDTLRNGTKALALTNSKSITLTYKSDAAFKVVLPMAGTGDNDFCAALPSTGGVEKPITILLDNKTFTQEEGWGTIVTFNKAKMYEINFMPTVEGKTTYLEITSISIDGLDSQVPVTEPIRKTAAAGVKTTVNGQNLNLTFDAQKAGTAAVSLYSMNGREVVRSQASVAGGTNTLSLSTANLANGIYVMRLSVNGAVSTSQISLMK